jgi:hypothetical protein
MAANDDIDYAAVDETGHYVLNALNKETTVQVQGRWFTFKPNQIKRFGNKTIADFICMNRGYEGLVEISKETMTLDKNGPEYKAYVAHRREEGVQKRINHLEFLRNNLLTSVRFDVEAKGMKTDPLTFASKGEVAAIKELKVLGEEVRKVAENNADQIRKILAEEGIVVPDASVPAVKGK